MFSKLIDEIRVLRMAMQSLRDEFALDHVNRLSREIDKHTEELRRTISGPRVTQTAVYRTAFVENLIFERNTLIAERDTLREAKRQAVVEVDRLRKESEMYRFGRAVAIEARDEAIIGRASLEAERNALRAKLADTAKSNAGGVQEVSTPVDPRGLRFPAIGHCDEFVLGGNGNCAYCDGSRESHIRNATGGSAAR